MPPTPSPKQDTLFNSWSFTTEALSQDVCFVTSWPPALPVPGTLPRGISVICLAHKGTGNMLYVSHLIKDAFLVTQIT
jgi:hypothetical protein